MSTPVHRSTLGKHQLRRAQAPMSMVLLSMLAACGRYHIVGLVINANLEAVGTPVHRVGAALGLDVGTGGVDVFGNRITTVQPAGKPPLSVVTHVSLVGFLSREKGRGWLVGHRCRNGYLVGLQMCPMHIQRPSNSGGLRDGGHSGQEGG